MSEKELKDELEYCYSTLDTDKNGEDEDLSYIDYDMRQADLVDAYEEWEEHSRNIIFQNTLNKMLKKQMKTERRKYLKSINQFLKS